MQELDAADLETLHPSRSKALSTSNNHVDSSHVQEERSKHKPKERPRQLTKTERLELAEQQRQEQERNQKEREKKIKQREKKRRDLRKMTNKGQPVMKTRLENLLGKVKKAMKEN